MTLYIQPNLKQFPTSSVLTVDDIRFTSWLGVSEEPTTEQIVAAGYVPVPEPSGTQPNDTTLVVDKDQSGEYTALWMSNTAFKEIIDNRVAAGFVRSRRNASLKQTDWTQCKDVPDAVSSKYTAYRQALRDITEQPGFPLTITWPVSP